MTLAYLFSRKKIGRRAFTPGSQRMVLAVPLHPDHFKMGVGRVRRDIVAMLFWALRWHEGRRVSSAALCDVLWGEFASKPKDPDASLRELMAYVQQRHGDKWVIEDCGRAFRILPRLTASKSPDKSNPGQPYRAVHET
jgi:hypothetical protein